MRIGDVNQNNYRDFLNLLGINNKQGLSAQQKTAKGSSAESQMAGPFDLATLQRMAAGSPTIKSVSIVNGKPHYEIDPSKHVSPMGFTGMVVTADTKYEMVPISDELRNRIIENEKNMIINNYGNSGSDFTEQESIYRDALTVAPEKDRINVSYTIGKTMVAESNRMLNMIEEAIPGWKPGQAFDKDFVRNLIEDKSLDIKV